MTMESPIYCLFSYSFTPQVRVIQGGRRVQSGGDRKGAEVLYTERLRKAASDSEVALEILYVAEFYGLWYISNY